MRSDSSSDMPGIELMLMVNEPSLNFGRKLCPKVKNRPTAATNSAAVTVTTGRLWSNAQTSPRS